MINVLHIYDNKPDILAWEGIFSAYCMAYWPCDILDLCPEVLLTKKFSLIVFDVSGKDSSPAVTFNQLKKWFEISGAPHPPIVVLAQKGSELTEQSARMAGADFFFIQPVDMKKLARVFEQITSST